jgi:ATP-dependent Lhr-like helicase
VMWGRLSPHPSFSTAPATVSSSESSGANEGAAHQPRRVRPTRVAPVAIFRREDAGWLLSDGGPCEQPAARAALSHSAREVSEALGRRGASFLHDLVRDTGRLPSEVEDGLWELVAAGVVTADGFDNLRALVDPKRRSGEGRWRFKRPRHAAGRWALLRRDVTNPATLPEGGSSSPKHSEGGPSTEAFARQLLKRWGVVFRDLLARETLAPAWRDLLIALRRMEARGEIRGGRFVDGFLGEQFARPEAVDLLRAIRRKPPLSPLTVSAADPLNLAGIITPGPRVSPLAAQTVEILDTPSEAAQAAS